MDASNHPSILKADPDTPVRTTVSIPEDVHQAARLHAQRQGCNLSDVVTEGLRLFFASLKEEGS